MILLLHLKIKNEVENIIVIKIIQLTSCITLF